MEVPATGTATVTSMYRLYRLGFVLGLGYRWNSLLLDVTPQRTDKTVQKCEYSSARRTKV